jgi:hypothetical protein
MGDFRILNEKVFGVVDRKGLILSVESAGPFQARNLLMKPASTTARVDEEPGSIHCGI